MARTDEKRIWTITVHFYPAAAVAGLQPVDCERLSFSESDEWSKDPAGAHRLYKPLEIHFEYPPSREDFRQAVSQVSWMAHLADHKNLFASLDANDWPMIDYCLKAAHVYLKDDQGRQVGHVDVRRLHYFANRAYNTLPILGADIHAVCGRCGVGQCSVAHEAIRASEHKLKERLTQLDHQPGEEDVRQVIRDFLEERGIAPRSRKPRIVQSV